MMPCSNKITLFDIEKHQREVELIINGFVYAEIGNIRDPSCLYATNVASGDVEDPSCLYVPHAAFGNDGNPSCCLCTADSSAACVATFGDGGKISWSCLCTSHRS